jgi:hypothetical protein
VRVAHLHGAAIRKPSHERKWQTSFDYCRSLRRPQNARSSVDGKVTAIILQAEMTGEASDKWSASVDAK